MQVLKQIKERGKAMWDRLRWRKEPCKEKEPRKPLSWDEIESHEQGILRKRRDDCKEWKEPNAVVGLALSGGGIRSATFNLGIMQVLETAGILKLVDYLSTVSGGGYAGAFLLAERFRGKKLPDEQAGKDDPALRHLRQFSNYLTPSMGLFSMDTWTMVMIWLRNTITLQTFLVCSLAVFVLLPRVYGWALHGGCQGPGYEIAAGLLLQTLTMLLSYVAAEAWKGVTGERTSETQREAWCKTSKAPKTEKFVAFAVSGVNLLMVVCAVLYSMRLHGDIWDARIACRFGVQVGDAIFALALFSMGYSRGVVRWKPWVLGSAAIVATNPAWLQMRPEFDLWQFHAAAVLVHWVVLLVMVEWCGQREKDEGWLDIGRAVLAALAGAVVGYGGIKVLQAVFLGQPVSLWAGDGKWFWHYVMFAAPALLAVFALTLVAMMAMTGRAMPDLVRESWSRLGAGLGILSAGIFAVVGFAIYSPRWTEYLHDGWETYVAGAGGGTAVVVSVVSFFTAKGAGSSGKKDGKTSRMDMLSSIAPVAFIVFLLGAVSFGVHCLVSVWLPPEWTRWAELRRSVLDMRPIMCVMGACAFVALLLAWRVDINEYSLNRFYRNRLARCFVGAGRADLRKASPLHGFDDNDDLNMGLLRKFLEDHWQSCAGGALGYETPIPIINTALNVVGGDDAVLSERRAHSLFFTPFHVYSNATMGMDTQWASTGRHPGDVTLGSLVAISGAAANPNMGFHSSPAIAFLLTFFNVRLGWWFRNENTPKGLCARFTLGYLFRELFGFADDDDAHVNISDGGHFDNLGLYELVRRKCDLIFVGDGEEDGGYTFESLGMAIRRCRVDFGAEIEIDVSRIRPGESGVSRTHYAIGRVKYACKKPGLIVYFKSSVTGREPYDVEQYKRQNKDFPHQSTGDQFFSESQFESYRQVGMSAGKEFIAAIGQDWGTRTGLLQCVGKL